jgi:hypothetical protein
VISAFSAFYNPAMFKNAEFAEFARKTQIALTALRAGAVMGKKGIL